MFFQFTKITKKLPSSLIKENSAHTSNYALIIRTAQHLQKCSKNYKVTFKKFVTENILCARSICGQQNYILALQFVPYRDTCNMLYAQVYKHTGNMFDRQLASYTDIHYTDTCIHVTSLNVPTGIPQKHGLRVKLYVSWCANKITVNQWQNSFQTSQLAFVFFYQTFKDEELSCSQMAWYSTNGHLSKY